MGFSMSVSGADARRMMRESSSVKGWMNWPSKETLLPSLSFRGVITTTESQARTTGRKERECGQMGVRIMAGTSGERERATGREVVTGGARGGGEDDAVGAEGGRLVSVDLHVEFDHAEGLAGVDDDVVESDAGSGGLVDFKSIDRGGGGAFDRAVESAMDGTLEHEAVGEGGFGGEDEGEMGEEFVE